MLPAERKSKIIDYVKINNAASVAQLAKEFQVHEATIRRDLAEIEKEGRLRRTHGGVVLPEGISTEASFHVRASEQVEEKQRIGKKAAEMINEGEHIILDSGTTTLQIAKYLVNRSNITVVTNDINIAAELKDSTGIQVIVTGGILYRENYCLNGMYTNQVLQSLHVHKAFMGTAAIHYKAGLTHPDEQIVPPKVSMIHAAQEVIVVTDHMKLGVRSLHNVAPINAIETLITGKEAPELHLQKFEEAGVKVFTV